MQLSWVPCFQNTGSQTVHESPQSYNQTPTRSSQVGISKTGSMEKDPWRTGFVCPITHYKKETIDEASFSSTETEETRLLSSSALICDRVYSLPNKQTNPNVLHALIHDSGSCFIHSESTELSLWDESYPFHWLPFASTSFRFSWSWPLKHDGHERETSVKLARVRLSERTFSISFSSNWLEPFLHSPDESD